MINKPRPVMSVIMLLIIEYRLIKVLVLQQPSSKHNLDYFVFFKFKFFYFFCSFVYNLYLVFLFLFLKCYFHAICPSVCQFVRLIGLSLRLFCS